MGKFRVMNRHEERRGLEEAECGCLHTGAVMCCRLHAAAPRMLEGLRRVVASGGLPGANLQNAIDYARAILRDFEREWERLY